MNTHVLDKNKSLSMENANAKSVFKELITRVYREFLEFAVKDNTGMDKIVLV